MATAGAGEGANDKKQATRNKKSKGKYAGEAGHGKRGNLIFNQARSRRPKGTFPGLEASTAELEAIVFGQALDLQDDTAGADTREQEHTSSASAAQTAARGNKRQRANASAGENRSQAKQKSKAAWVDEDDATLEVDLTKQNRTKKLRKTDLEVKVAGDEYEKRLREQFVKIHGSANWAEPRPDTAADDDVSSDEDREGSQLLATSAKPTASSGAHGLMPMKIDIARRQPVPIAEPGTWKRPAVMQALQFHRDSELLLAAGLDKTLRIYSVDGEENPRISKHFFENFPIANASFTPDGDQVLLTGTRDDAVWSLDVRTGNTMFVRPQPTSRHRSLHGLTVGPSDAPGLRGSKMFAVLGDSGTIMVCDIPSKQPVRTLRMSMKGVAAVFSQERDVIWSADFDNNIYEWDIGTGRCKQKCKATWATGIWSMALRGTSANAPTSQLAVGTTSGNIDLYDISGPKFPKEPSLSFNNLVTQVSGLHFHPGGELLVGFSRQKANQMKLMHCASGTVYQNWPTQKTSLDIVAQVAMSRKRGWFALANERGKVLLYQLRHYE